MNQKKVSVSAGPLLPVGSEHHPEIASLINLIAFADELIIADGHKTYFAISGSAHKSPRFVFTKTRDGYLLTRSENELGSEDQK